MKYIQTYKDFLIESVHDSINHNISKKYFKEIYDKDGLVAWLLREKSGNVIKEVTRLLISNRSNTPHNLEIGDIKLPVLNQPCFLLMAKDFPEIGISRKHYYQEEHPSMNSEFVPGPEIEVLNRNDKFFLVTTQYYESTFFLQNHLETSSDLKANAKKEYDNIEKKINNFIHSDFLHKYVTINDINLVLKMISKYNSIETGDNNENDVRLYNIFNNKYLDYSETNLEYLLEILKTFNIVVKEIKMDKQYLIKILDIMFKKIKTNFVKIFDNNLNDLNHLVKLLPKDLRVKYEHIENATEFGFFD